MTRSTKVTMPDTSTNSGEQWDTVAEESAVKVVFDTIGDMFQGEYAGIEHIEPETGQPFDLIILRENGKRYALNTGYKLSKAFEKVAVGQYVRVTYVADIETGQPSPMKDFRVDVRR